MRTGSSAAESDPKGRFAARPASATLTSTATPEGAFVLLDSIFEDVAPRDFEGALVDQRAQNHWDFTDDYDVHDLDCPPPCDRGPHHLKGEL